ncbi:hypothetical protein [Hymenobacter persicinus]|uniref:Uncharacterized protein n=1 Tax=Hymenobacter persicinus TaxID=2025506 RepID=A0A4Q5LCD7_9BACT|nr:hypothetical protein [Hymenobacter persicinus]RYU77843.1 hypothetical protein EWM57_16440 [Hymenobacter persicinus]
MTLPLLLLLLFYQAPQKPVYDRQEYAAKLTKEFFRGDFWDFITYPDPVNDKVSWGYFATKGEARKTATILPIPVVEYDAAKAGYRLKKDLMKAFVLKSGQLIAIANFHKGESEWYGGYDNDLPTSRKLYAAYLLGPDEFYLSCSTSSALCGYILLKNDREYRWNHGTKSFE